MDPYAVLTEDATKGVYVGTSLVGGVECDHLAFRNPTGRLADLGLEGEQPLPLKYVITTKWITARRNTPAASELERDTADRPGITFTPPHGAKKLKDITADEIGELTAEDVQ